MEIKGKIVSLLQLQTGQGKNGTWKKQEFILETLGQFPKKVCISLWGEDLINKYDLHVLLEVTAYVNPESREYNGRWYTELRAWKITWDEQAARKWQNGNQQPATSTTQRESYPSDDSKDELPF